MKDFAKQIKKYSHTWTTFTILFSFSLALVCVFYPAISTMDCTAAQAHSSRMGSCSSHGSSYSSPIHMHHLHGFHTYRTDLDRSPSLMDQSYWPDSSAQSAESSPTLLLGNVEKYRATVIPQNSVPVPSLMNSTEDRLLRLHDHNEIGTFDIDEFSQRLLQIKRNYATMIEKKSRLSPSQDTEIRAELSGLNKEICSRI